MGCGDIGASAGIVVVFAVEIIDKVLKIDDPVGAIAVHGVCGALGTILTGMLALDGGLLYGGGWSLVAAQCTGVVTVAIWVAVTIAIVFGITKATIGLRATPEEEMMGLDTTEHALASAYADFTAALHPYDSDYSSVEFGDTPINKAVTVEYAPKSPEPAAPSDTPKVKMTKVDIIFNQKHFEAFKAAMFSIGITGMTVTNVMGCDSNRRSRVLPRRSP